MSSKRPSSMVVPRRSAGSVGMDMIFFFGVSSGRKGCKKARDKMYLQKDVKYIHGRRRRVFFVERGNLEN